MSNEGLKKMAVIRTQNQKATQKKESGLGEFDTHRIMDRMNVPN